MLSCYVAHPLCSPSDVANTALLTSEEKYLRMVQDYRQEKLIHFEKGNTNSHGLVSHYDLFVYKCTYNYDNPY